VCLVRVGGASVFPCDFLLVAAMNPCPCGFAGDPQRSCTCDYREKQRYRRKLSGPLLDRIDLHVSVPAVSWSDLVTGNPAEGSRTIRERVLRARHLAASRFPARMAFRNAELPVRDFERILALDASSRRLLGTLMERLGLSLRAMHRALRVSRTIADLSGCERVSAAHLAEAVGYRHRTSSEIPGRLDRAGPTPVRFHPKPRIQPKES